MSGIGGKTARSCASPRVTKSGTHVFFWKRTFAFAAMKITHLLADTRLLPSSEGDHAEVVITVMQLAKWVGYFTHDVKVLALQRPNQ